MKTIRFLSPCIVAGVLLSALSANATPYASGVTNISGTVQFILNELPDSAWVIFEDGSSNSIASPVVGTNTFSLGSHTKFGIYVKKSGVGTPSQISSDAATYNNWNTPRGVGINVNATNGYLFGRVYINNSLAGSVLANGLYALNADQSIILGGTNGLLGSTWTNAGSSSSPYRIHVGQDNNLYLGDFTSLNANVYQAAPDLSSVTEFFGEQGESAGIAAGVHGRSFGRPIELGSIATSNMVLWVADASLPIGSDTTLGYNAAIGDVNNIDRYTIGAGPLPWTNAPDLSMNLGINSIADLDDDVDIGPVSGNIFGMNYRANYGMPCMQVYDPTGMNLLWSSLEGPINVGPDFFNFDFSGSQFSMYAFAISPDERFLAAGLINNPILILDLTNGVPDTSTLLVISNAPNSSGYEDIRSICWDAADNVYTVSSGQGLLRVFSLGLPATCVTSNDVTGTNGTFQLLLPSITASVTATAPLASQNHGSPIPGAFTITLNTNFLSSPLIVNFVLGGTATNGTYVSSATNNVTFAAGTSPSGNWSQTVTITPTATPVIGPTMTVTLTVDGGVTYLSAAPVQATVAIANTGPQYFSVTSLTASNLYRGLNKDFGEFVITRLGDTNVGPVTLTNFTYTGTATFGVDYLAGAQLETGSYPATGSPGVVFNAGDVSKQVIVGAPVPTPFGSPAVGNESIIVGLGTTNSQLSQEGISYTTGSATAALTLLDNAYPPEFVLWTNPLTNAIDSSNWTLTFAGTNLGTNTVPPVVISAYPNNESGAPLYPNDSGGTNDFDVEFGYGVASDGVGQSLAMAAKGWTNALKMSVNKDQNFAGASMGVNVYPTGQTFGGNFAFRFSMCLVEGTGYTGTFLSEAAEFGIDHSGTNCNWVSGDIVLGPPQIGSGYTNIDGVWIALDSAAGVATGGTPPDFGLYTGGTSTLQGLPNSSWYQPVSDPGTGEATVFKHPTPYDATGSGTPATILPTGVWSDVDLEQLNGTVTLFINKTPVLTYAVTNQFTNGEVMFGYDDPFANTSVGSGAAVYYSDARVVELAPYITSITPTNLTIDLGGTATFTATAIGSEPFTNVWYLGPKPVNTNIVTTTVDSSSLVMASPTPADSGNYTVEISDRSGGSVTSSVVTLTVLVPRPDITGVTLNPSVSQAILTFTTGNPYDTTSSFTLQSSTNLAGINAGFTNVVGASFTLTNGVFTVPAPTDGPDTFYRLLHN